MELLTLDMTEQERELARALYTAERFGEVNTRRTIPLPPLYVLLVRSLRKGDNFNKVLKALEQVGKSNGLIQ